ncbi:voltage-gated potassium channel regulatory subunit KCNG2 [Mobula birostris]|uniref:voltage-gated potassium channel regulatory subunit KCNG2 n=1 Tax=Mobula birostris TaxID=1983395 RepID=UPI003B27BAE1
MALLAEGKSERQLGSFTCTLEKVENCTRKGIYYQQAKLLQPNEDAYSIAQLNDRTFVIVNVGGNKYQIPWTTLDQIPLTRLGKLKACSNYEEIMNICDDYDVNHNEFFFDRNPCAFRTIMTFLTAGKLRLLREMCALSFQEELVYWGIEDENLEWCCRRKLYQKVEDFKEIKRDFEVLLTEEPQGAFDDTTRLGYCMKKLRDMVEDPDSGIPGKIFACLSVLFVTITTVSLCVSTMPDLRQEEERGECSQKCYNMFVLETVCVAWFSFEFLLRFIQAQSKCTFLRTPLNIIDIMAILPYYISLIIDAFSVEEKPSGSGNLDLEKIGLVLRVLRALRILYVMRLVRHSLGLQTLGLTIQRCTREFGLLVLFLCVAMALYSPLVFLAERELGAKHEFASIPSSYWWAVISMTTVGYGDMVPRSIPGQVVALSSILSGILLMAFPVTSIFHTFSRSYLELKDQQQRISNSKAQLKGDIKSPNSDSSQETDISFPMNFDKTRELRTQGPAD